jgi:hypothetical protein
MKAWCYLKLHGDTVNDVFEEFIDVISKFDPYVLSTQKKSKRETIKDNFKTGQGQDFMAIENGVIPDDIKALLENNKISYSWEASGTEKEDDTPIVSLYNAETQEKYTSFCLLSNVCLIGDDLFDLNKIKEAQIWQMFLTNFSFKIHKSSHSYITALSSKQQDFLTL